MVEKGIGNKSADTLVMMSEAMEDCGSFSLRCR